jgi:hypothetical protein
MARGLGGCEVVEGRPLRFHGQLRKGREVDKSGLGGGRMLGINAERLA